MTDFEAYRKLYGCLAYCVPHYASVQHTESAWVTPNEHN